MQICSHFQLVVLQKCRQWQTCEETERDKTLICILEGSCNQRTVMKDRGAARVVFKKRVKDANRELVSQASPHLQLQQRLPQIFSTLPLYLHCEAGASHQKMHAQKKVKASKKRHRTANHSLPL